MTRCRNADICEHLDAVPMQRLVYGANADVMLTLMLFALYSTGGKRVMHARCGVVENAMQCKSCR